MDVDRSVLRHAPYAMCRAPCAYLFFLAAWILLIMSCAGPL